jgi:hypothetical protein
VPTLDPPQIRPWVGGHPSQHVQQMGDGGPQSIGPGFDTMLENGSWALLNPKASSKVEVYPQPYK